MKNPLDKKISLSGDDIAAKDSDKGTKRKLASAGKKALLLVMVLFGVLAAGAIFVFVFGFLPLREMKTDLEQLNRNASAVFKEIQAQNLNQAVNKLGAVKEDFNNLKSHYQKLAWLKIVPFANRYYQDGQHLVKGGDNLLSAADLTLEALKPYADILGLEGKGETKKPEEMTTEQRLLLALSTLDKLQPSLDGISNRLDLARKEVDQIDPNRYPETLFGKQVRKRINELVEMINGTAQIASEVKPIVSYLGPLLGVDKERRYLLLFQNDAELRPTGGFLTAYAILSVHNGKFSVLASHDIYSLDARFGDRLKAPDPILNYHKNVFSWHLRDMNLSPDFQVSMKTFMENYERVEGKGTVDGVIAVDTKVLVGLLKALGPIGVSGWGNFSAENDSRCDCPQVVYELERYADKPVTGMREERKGIIGPLMHSIILNAMGSPRKKWPEFFNITLTNLQEKHILFYLFDDKIQKALEVLNAGGRIKEYTGDYLHINDCNFAGAKSNMFIKETVTQEIAIAQDGSVTKLLTIDYVNPAPPSNCNLEAGQLCLNGLYRDWVRIYVPEGSELLESSGSEIETKVYKDLGKTVFEAFYGDRSPLRPQGKAQLQFKYKLPFKAEKDQSYKLLIQKQPGTYGYEYIVKLNGKEETFDLSTDRELSL